MRVNPTSIDFGNLSAGNIAAVTAITVDQMSQYAIAINCAVSGGLTLANSIRLINDNNVNGFLGFSAEL
jgi:hypothetical protein